MATGSSKLAWMKFFPGDWIQDTRLLSPNAKGHWIDLICAMWISPTRGRITWGLLELANFLGVGSDALPSMLDHLGFVANIELLDVDGHRVKRYENAIKITIKSRRMLREERQRHQALDRDRRYKRRKSDAETTKRVQSPESRNKRREESQPSPEGRRSAQVLSDKIFENHPSRTAPTEAVLIEWSREADRIYKIDGHGWEEILSLIEWSQVDPFWKTNILSMSKFRKQWNQLTAHRSRGGEHGTKGAKGLESLKGWAGRLPKP
jgi:uncharacterized protein YdaU (DUF1376 family)